MFIEKMSSRICRTCLRRSSDYICLDDGKNSYSHKLALCVPEIEIDILKNPVLCDECAIKLDEAYKFRRACIENEKIINDNLTLKINLENALESNIDFQINNIAINEEYVNERKRQLSESLTNNSNIVGREESESKRCRTFSENSISEFSEIKQEPKSDVQVNDSDDDDVSFDGNSKGCETVLARETHDLPMYDVKIKNEQDFFYSEYEIDSKENNKVNLTSQEIIEIKVSKILDEHSYSSNFEVRESVENSETTINDTNDKVTCEVCKELYDEQFMSVHMDVHKNVKKVEAMKPQEDGYLSVKLSTEKKFMCRYCNKIFDDSTSLYDHINMMHNQEVLRESASKEILCKICNLFFDEKIIKRHIEVHEAEKIEVNVDSASRIKLICKVCGDIFSDEKLFTSHYQTHKQSQVTTTCTICGETYDQHSVKAHMEFHNIVEEIVLSDDVDEATFSSPNAEYSLQVEPSTTNTSGSETSNYSCCDKKFNNLYLLHLHTTRVHGYLCYICNIKFPNRQALGGHFRVHNEQKTHQCIDCGKYFAQRGNLLRHTHFVHNCIMPYKCDKCGQRFRRNKYLEEHMRGHTQRYACTECDRVFTELKILRRHKRYHVPRPHQCEVCDTVFTAKSSLVRHQRDIHKMKITGRRSYGLGDVVLGSN